MKVGDVVYWRGMGWDQPMTVLARFTEDPPGMRVIFECEKRDKHTGHAVTRLFHAQDLVAREAA